MDVRPFDNFLSLQDFRNGTGLVVDAPADALKNIQDFLAGYDNEYEYTSNTCAGPIQDALTSQFGFGARNLTGSLQKTVFPAQLQNSIMNNFPIIKINYYDHGRQR